MVRPRLLLWHLLLLAGALCRAELDDFEESLDQVTEAAGSEGMDQGGEDEGEDVEMIQPDQLRQLHEKMDTDGDGNIHMDELHEHIKMIELEYSKQGVMSAQFRKAVDRDGDGQISVKEMTGDEPGKASVNQAADADGDGFLSEEELLSVVHPASNPVVFALEMKRLFDAVDADKSGTISQAEFQTSEGRGMAGFEVIDANSDGGITFEEYRYLESGQADNDILVKQLFEHADKDGDYHLSKEELAAADLNELHANSILTLMAEHHEL